MNLKTKTKFPSQRNRVLLKIAALGLALAASPAFGQVPLSGGAYTQDFNSLPSTAVSSNTWANNSTLLGWYCEAPLSPVVFGTGGECTNIIASAGTGSTGAFYSFGTNNAVTDRALGSIGANGLAASGSPSMAYGIRFTNDTGYALTNFTVSYTGEQWRDAGNAAAQSLTFAYRVDSSPITSADPTSVATWNSVGALTFTSPIHSGSTVVLDGNASANRTVFTGVILSGFVVLPGQEIFFRWLDVNDSGNDHALAIDDLSISFETNLTAGVTGPTISTNPANTTVGEGSPATFNVSATGTQPLYYQWYSTNSGTTTLIDGATGSTFTTNYVTASLSGFGFFVIVSNNAPSANVVTSSVAILTVTNVPPVVATIHYLHSLRDANFKLNDTNTLYQVQGVVVTSGNLVSSPGQSCFIQDNTGGMDVFFRTGFTLPNQGDLVRVTAQLDQFNGVLEIHPIVENSTHKVEVLSSGNTIPTPQYFDFSSINPVTMEDSIEGSYVIVSNVFLGITNNGGNLIGDQTVFMTNAIGKVFSLRVPSNVASDPVGYPLPGTYAKSVRGVMAQFQGSGTVLTNNYGMYLDLRSNIEVGTPPAPKPTIQNISIVAGNILLSGTNNDTSGGRTYYVLASTNITLPMSQWISVLTNAFDGAGNFSESIPVGSGTQLFYTLQVP